MPITVEDVSFSYASNAQLGSIAVDKVSMKIHEGEFLVIMGEIGSGKSTLIKHFNGLLKPLSGKVTVDGYNSTSVQARKLVGMLFQFPQQQLFGRTVFEDVAFAPSNFGISDKELRTKVIESLKLVGLDENIVSKSPFSLSNGHMRLVALAGIIAAGPKYLVLDEPSTGLDPKSRNELFKALQEIRATGITVVVVTHNIHHVLPLVTGVFFMERGKIVFEGSPEDYFLSEYSQVQDIPLLMRELRKSGLDVNDDVFTVEEAFREIMHIKKMRTGT